MTYRERRLWRIYIGGQRKPFGEYRGLMLALGINGLFDIELNIYTDKKRAHISIAREPRYY